MPSLSNFVPCIPPPRVRPADTAVESIAGEAVDIFDPTTVHTLELTVSADHIAALRSSPTEWVPGTLTFQGAVWEQVAVRVKGSSSFQSIDQKPALKLKFHEYISGQRFHGLERLTLNNEVWDSTMMAETLAYQAWRENGSAAPQTGYAVVMLNDRPLGLYAIIESMDDDFIERQWPDSNGGLWEMTRDCDFNSDCSCFDLQETGSQYVDNGIVRGCEAVLTGTIEALQAAFDWEALIAFLAVEIAVNHPDSYSHNLNNFFVYHDPGADKIHLSPWGADSTFTYIYPPDIDNPKCEPLYYDVLESAPSGWLMGFCLSNTSCRAELRMKVLSVADWMEESDLIAQMETLSAMLDPYAAQETEVYWTMADRKQQVGCFIDWTRQRPTELRAWAN